MNIRITTFQNPFSFFCITEDFMQQNFIHHNEYETNQKLSNIDKITEFNHGQYVAVMWNNKWARGVVYMESQILIWLIDYGIFIRSNEAKVVIDLPIEYRRLPTKVFEASIHGVMPVDKVWTWEENFQINNNITTNWSEGSKKIANELILNSVKTYFKPIAVLATRHNDVVLGNLYLDIPGKGMVNIVDELQQWPVFLEQNKKAYVENFSTFYLNRRRRHRACLLKPEFQGFKVPTINLEITFDAYTSIVAESLSVDELHEISSVLEDDDSTVLGNVRKDKRSSKITPSDIEKYSKQVITLHGREYNVLSVLINKARDLNICEKYKDHDLKSVGRGISYKSRRLDI